MPLTKNAIIFVSEYSDMEKMRRQTVMKKVKRVFAVLLSVCMALAMYPAMAFADGEAGGGDAAALPESEHSYTSNFDDTWSYLMECAHHGLYVTFDSQTETEANYDFIYILDGNDQQIGRYSGTALAGKTIYIPTPGFKIRLTTDGSGNRWGFKVASVDMAEEFVDLTKVGSVDDVPPAFVGEAPNVTVRVNDQALDASTDFSVTYDTSTVGETEVTVTGKGSYTGTLKKPLNVVDNDHLAVGAAVSEANISLKQSGDDGSSYVNFNDATSAWTSSIDSLTLTPVEPDGVTATDPGTASYPKAPKEITLTKDQLHVSGSRVSFARTAEEPVVYVLEGRNPVDIRSRWGTNTYPQSQKYRVTVKARGYQDTTGYVTYYTGTSPEFSIIIDADGQAGTTDDRTTVKSWTSDEIAAMAEFANGSSQCGMTGFRTFSGNGVTLKKLLDEAGVEVSDSDYFLLDTSDHYGNNFTYDALFGQKRYFLSTIYTEEFADFYLKLMESASDSESGSVTELRRYLASHVTDADVVEPRVNVDYTETLISGNQITEATLPTAENQNFNDLVAYENQFRFFYGIALVQNDCNVTFDSQGGTEVEAQLVKSHPMTSTENTTMKSSYWANSLVVFRGAGDAYKTEPSKAADKITRPADPTRVGYTFGGWYTDADCTKGNEFEFTADGGTVDENITLYAKWTEGTSLPESDHDYPSNFDRTCTWDYGEGADHGLIVTFSKDTETEKGYDFITIYDAEGNELGSYSGTELAGKKVYVPTSKVQIRLTSDRSNNAYGFRVNKIEPCGETVDLSQFGKIAKIDAVPVDGQPSITVTVNNTTLTEGTDYTVEYDTSAAGRKTATVTGIGNYAGTLTRDFMVYAKAVKIIDFDITNAEHDDADQERNQTVIATLTFDSDVRMLSDTLNDELLITIAGGDVNSTSRDVTYEVQGNQLIIRMVSTDWVAVYNGILSISESENGLFSLTGTEEGSAVVWETQSDNIPIGIVVTNTVTPGTSETPATTTATVQHKANMRGMYHFQLVSIVDGEETVVGTYTSHAHAFYGAITKEAIAKAMASAINNQEGYSTVYTDGETSFVIRADEAVDGQTLAVRMKEIKTTVHYDKTPDEEAAEAVEAKIEAIGEVTEGSEAAIQDARAACDALTEAQKALVSEDALKTLQDAEKTLSDRKAAADAETKIEAIGTVTADSGDAIREAREAFDALTDDQKALVSDEAKKALEDAESAWDALNQFTNPYRDVAEGTWYYDNVMHVTKKGIFSGNADGTFNPDGTMKRSEFAQVLYNLEGKPAVATQAGFRDVESGKWYADAVNWAAATDCGNGQMLVSGYSNENFGPDDLITREQMMTLLHRYAQYKNADTSQKNDLSAFTDKDSVQSYAREAVQWTVGAGIVNGVTATTLEPAGNATRAQVAKVFDMYTDLIG